MSQKRLGSPLESNYKEKRLDSPKMADENYASYAKVTKSSKTFSTETEATGSRRSRNESESSSVVVEEDHVLKTDGAIRNNFTVDILQLNGQDFKGSISRSDALRFIFIGALGFKPENLGGVVPGFRGNPTVLFKTKTTFNIDEIFAGKSKFSFVKRIKEKDGEKTNVYDCSVRGIREEESKPVSIGIWRSLLFVSYHIVIITA
jgi:hypothetical protein